MEKTTMVGLIFCAILCFLVVGLYLGKIDGATFTAVLSSVGAFATIILAIIVPDKNKSK